jgi:hypothetical protein
MRQNELLLDQIEAREWRLLNGREVPRETVLPPADLPAPTPRVEH